MHDMDTTTTIVIFGGTGDLSKKKLLSALLDLYVHDRLPKKFTIIGTARTPYTDTEYQEMIKDVLVGTTHHHTLETIEAFCTHLQYVAGSSDDQSLYEELDTKIYGAESKGQGSNVIFYLAVPPTLYESIFTKLAEHNLSKPRTDDTYVRILLEKPFGRDFNTAQELDAKLSALYSEDQIYRIDHYLAKEAVQNILAFRFANTFFTSPWNNNYIDEIHIQMHESIDVGTRGNFYESIGALRDVGQNHLLQLLALIAMDEPEQFTPENIRDKRAEVLKKLIPETAESITSHVYKAQYNEYRTTKDVDDDSQTETFFSLTAYLDDPTWKGVPFHIEAGKGLPENSVSVKITFKDIVHDFFKSKSMEEMKNVITLDISPHQKMHITLNAKASGHEFTIEPRTLSFHYAEGDTDIVNAYEKVLLDCILGDCTLFTKTDEVLASWKYITSILENWETLPLHAYNKGTYPE